MVHVPIGRSVLVSSCTKFGIRVHSSVHGANTTVNSGRPSPVYSCVRSVVPVQLCIRALLCMAVDPGYPDTAVPCSPGQRSMSTDVGRAWLPFYVAACLY